MKSTFFSFVFIAFLFSGQSCQQNPDIKTSENVSIDYEAVVEGLGIPWGIDFLPNGDMLVTEKAGKLSLFSNGAKTDISGLPEVYKKGQGGLLDIRVHPKYAENGWIYISYACEIEGENGGNTALMRFKIEGNQITNKEKLFQATPASSDGRHFGSRIEFDNDGYLFLSVGERGNWDNAQLLTNHSGKIHRFNDDGSIPEDNPFVNETGAMKSIYSYGHRNPQGLVLSPDGVLWEHEHGPRGGDEVNIIEKGKNYGWPLVTYGINYNGQVISPDTEKEGLEQPQIYWKPSIAPSGMAFITTNKYGNDLKGDILAGSLKFSYLHRCKVENGKIVEEERLIKDIGRVRVIKEGPDGFIYVGVETGKVLKLLPK